MKPVSLVHYGDISTNLDQAMSKKKKEEEKKKRRKKKKKKKERKKWKYMQKHTVL